jgi:hypothetical protein
VLALRPICYVFWIAIAHERIATRKSRGAIIDKESNVLKTKLI